MDHHHALEVLAGAAASAVLLLPLAAGASGPGQASGQATDQAPEPRTRPCFIEPLQGYHTLDGPVPSCPAPGFPAD